MCLCVDAGLQVCACVRRCGVLAQCVSASLDAGLAVFVAAALWLTRAMSALATLPCCQGCGWQIL
jgi:hypothetical protein